MFCSGVDAGLLAEGANAKVGHLLFVKISRNYLKMKIVPKGNARPKFYYVDLPLVFPFDKGNSLTLEIPDTGISCRSTFAIER